VKTALLVVVLMLLFGCGAGDSNGGVPVGEFLEMYNQLGRRLHTSASEANWRASTDATPEHTGERIGAESAQAAFRGSRYIIETSQKLLDARDALTDLEFRQLDKILLLAAESPGTAPELVRRRMAAEARVAATLADFTFCLDRRGERCVSPISRNEIESGLRNSRDLTERRHLWEVSKQIGLPLKPGLAELRDLRNQLAKELGYTSYFHLQVADYGMSVEEMMALMDETLGKVRPLYDELHMYARRRLAKRYGKPVPKQIPAHWLPDEFAQAWPGIAMPGDLDNLFQGKTEEWIVRQAENFYTSLGLEPLPESFWVRSDLYALPPGSTRHKNVDARSWHIDLDHDVRTLMSVEPNLRWFVTSHHELGHVYYFLAYSNPNVPPVLREGLNRAFHEAIGSLIGMAARREPYLREIGLLPADRKLDRTQMLLDEALDAGIVSLPWSAGVMTHFERDLYEDDLPVDQFNERWWGLVERYQGVVPPTPRGEQFCDACTKTHIIEKPARYYDYAIAQLIKYQLNDYIAREILHVDPREASYYGNKEVGAWLMSILEVGATRDWREVLKEKTGEDLSSRAMLQYFQPLTDYLKTENAKP